MVTQRLWLSQTLAPMTELPRAVAPHRWKWTGYLPSFPSLPRWRNSASPMAANEGVARLGGRPELDPGAARGGAVEFQPAATADEGRARLRVEPSREGEPDDGGAPGGNRLVGAADLQRRHGCGQVGWPGMAVA